MVYGGLTAVPVFVFGCPRARPVTTSGAAGADGALLAGLSDTVTYSAALLQR